MLVVGGTGSNGVTAGAAEIFDPTSGRTLAVPAPIQGRAEAATALLPSGRVLVAGGHFDTIFPVTQHRALSSAELWDDGLSPASAPRPALTSAPTVARAGTTVTLKGTGLAPLAGGGDPHATTRAASAIWIPAAGSGAGRGALVDVTDTQATWHVPATGLFGRGRLFVSVGGAIGAGVPIEIQPAAQASACVAGPDCASGFCVDGVCCDAACDGRCQACSAARKGSGVDGVCGDVPPERDPARCALFLGAKCTSSAQCGTGFCVDGVCCSSACDRQCEACDVEGSFGTCVPVSGAPHGPRAACAPGGADPCSAKVCDGVERASCGAFVGPKVACRAPACAAGIATYAAACDGTGACPTTQTQKCAPYLCAGDACATAPCKSDAECDAAFRCAIAQGASQGECVVRTDNVCDGLHTVTARDGSTTDCAPYLCDVQGCKTSCASSDDCVGGALCDQATTPGRCVVLSSDPPSGDGGGCASSGSERAELGASGVLLAGVAAARARRRRRGARSTR